MPFLARLGTCLGATLFVRESVAASDMRAQAERPVAFDVMLPLRNRDRLEAFVADLHTPGAPNFHRWLSPTEFGMRFGPDAASLEAAASALRVRGFHVSAQTRSLHVVGQAAQVEAAFGTRLTLGRNAAGMTRVVQALDPVMPAEIAAVGGQVFSFSPHMARKHAHVVTARLTPDNRLSTTGGYWFSDLKQAYAYPSVRSMVRAHDGSLRPLDGTGVTLGVLMSSDVYDSDIQAVFDHENWSVITGKPAPGLYRRVYVNGGATTASPELDEASLDVQQELTGAPGAQVILYDIPDLSDGNTLAGYLSIVEANRVDLVSSSFGGCEQSYAPAYNGGRSHYGILAAEHELFLQGNAQGITFVASSGDSAGKACPAPAYFLGQAAMFAPGVEVPAADPNVTAVGGTNLVTTAVPGTIRSVYVGENGWADPEIAYDPYGVGALASGGFWGAGGGYSAYFIKPWYQAMVRTGSSTRRAVPDVGMQVGGCPGGIAMLSNGVCDGGNLAQNGAGNAQRSYVLVSVGAGQPGGGFFGLIGTSVAAPEFAGATALLIEQFGRMGNLNPYLYRLAGQQAAGKGVFFHTGIAGFNGVVNTRLNGAYSLTTGVGTPIVAAYVAAGAVEMSGDPLTPSNP